MNRILIGALSAVALVAMAQQGTMESTTTGGSPVKIYTNVDMNATKLTGIDATTGDKTSLNMGYNLAVGADAVYMFDTAMGAGIGLDFNMLKGSKNGTTISNTYLDIPVNFAYN